MEKANTTDPTNNSISIRFRFRWTNNTNKVNSNSATESSTLLI